MQRRGHESIHRWLDDINDLLKKCHTGTPWCQEDFEQADCLMKAWDRQTPRLPRQCLVAADDLMTVWIAQSDDGSARAHYPTPDSEAYRSIILMYAKSRNNTMGAAQRSEDWLQRMLKASTEDDSEFVTPPRGSLFAAVLAAWEREAAIDRDAPLKGERLFQQWHKRALTSIKSDDDGGWNESPNAIQSMYYLHLSLWAKSHYSEGPVKAEALLREMVELGQGDARLAPSIPAFVNVLSAWRRQCGGRHEGDHINNKNDFVSTERNIPWLRAQAVLDLMVDEQKRRAVLPHPQMRLRLNDVPFNVAIHTWAASGLPLSHVHKRIENILKCMNKLDVKPTRVTTWSALLAYDHCPMVPLDDSNYDVPISILRLLEYTQRSGGGKNPKLLDQIYDKALDIICSERMPTKDETAVRAAEEILAQYCELPFYPQRTRTTMQGFEKVLKAWTQVIRTKGDTPTIRTHLLQILDRMETEADRIFGETTAPSVYLYLARGWASCSAYLPNHKPLSRSLDAVERMLKACREQPNNLPAVTWFQEIAQAAKAGHNESLATSNDVDVFLTDLSSLLANSSQFYRMLENLRVQRGQTDSLDADILNLVLDSLVRQSQSNEKSGDRAELVLLTMQELHEKGAAPPVSFAELKKVVDCQLNSKNDGAVERADEILSLAEAVYESGDVAMRPSMDGYMSVVEAWSDSHSEDAPEHIQKHLRKMQKLRLDGEGDYALDDRPYAALIKAYANSCRYDAHATAEAIFSSTPPAYKSTALYNALIMAQNGDANRAEALLHTMHQEFVDGNDRVEPNTESFNCVLAQWLRSGSPMAAWRADGIFKRMHDLSSSGQLNVNPNTKTFDLVISTLAQDWGSSQPFKVDRYLALLKEHYQSGAPDCTPSLTSYNEAIRAWGSNVGDDPRAVLRAKALLDEMHELARHGVDSVRPDRSTYQVYLEALSRSSADGRADLLQDVVRKMERHNVVLDEDLRTYIHLCQRPLDSRRHAAIGEPTA